MPLTCGILQRETPPERRGQGPFRPGVAEDGTRIQRPANARDNQAVDRRRIGFRNGSHQERTFNVRRNRVSCVVALRARKAYPERARQLLREAIQAVLSSEELPPVR